MAAGGYFGRALVVDASAGTAYTLPLPDELLRAYLGAAGRRPAGPGGAAGLRILPAGRHPADHEREVRGGREVPADRHAERRALLQPLRDLGEADRPRRHRCAWRL